MSLGIGMKCDAMGRQALEIKYCEAVWGGRPRLILGRAQQSSGSFARFAAFPGNLILIPDN
jgi:hypothetical protein